MCCAFQVSILLVTTTKLKPLSRPIYSETFFSFEFLCRSIKTSNSNIAAAKAEYDDQDNAEGTLML